jgi:hypothetical protein
MENGKQIHVVTFGKVIPRTIPVKTEPSAHQPRVDMDIGKVPNMIRPNIPIQKLPKLPTIAPRTLSLRVLGASHQCTKVSFF